MISLMHHLKEVKNLFDKWVGIYVSPLIIMMSWILFSAVITLMLGLDLFVFHKKSERIGVKEAISWSLFWVAISLGFAAYVHYSRGYEDALNFLTGYLIEKSLSIDNIFVFLLIFDYFNTPQHTHHKVLFWGVFGAIVMRAVLIASGLVLIQKFHGVIYILGAFLVYTGIKFWFSKDVKVDPEHNVVIRFFRKYFPVHPTYDDDHFFIMRGSRWIATPLFIVLICIETTDLVFAVDSIPAILAITYDPFIVYTSNIFALLGLRMLFFALAGMMKFFHYLHYGLSCILVLIGIKMLISGWIRLPIHVVLGIVVAILTLSIGISLLKRKA